MNHNDLLSIFKNNEDKFIYIHGKSGLGKTTYTIELLKDNNLEYYHIPLSKIKNEDDIDVKMNSKNIINMFNNTKSKYRYLIIDDIDYLSNNDKKILGILHNKIKVIKNKKSKDRSRYNDLKFIFIGTNYTDKKVKEIMKTCNIIEIQYPLFENSCGFREMNNINENVINILDCKYDYNKVFASDKSSIVMIFHENIIDVITKMKKKISSDKLICFYKDFLQNICYSDVYDRISFQKQIWRLTEISHHIKLNKNYELYYNFCKNNKLSFNNVIDVKDVVFTKILTKYSNEYSNLNYIIDICNSKCIKKYELYKLLINETPNIFSDSQISRLHKIFSL